MTSEYVRIVIAVGLLLALILLRLQSESFGAAEYDEPGNRYHRGFWTRLCWYALGLALLAAIYGTHPQPHDVLFLVVGKHVDVFTFGLSLAVVGAAQAAIFAWFRYGGLRLPAPSAYPGAALNSVLTAVIDEAAFRGALQGMLLAAGLPDGSAILTQAIVYVLATRMGAPGRHRYMLVLSLGIGIGCGWATVRTGGIGAAILAHTLTSFALFVCTGHAGQVAARGSEPDEVEALHKPEGWRDARRSDEVSGRGQPG
ncbi:MAG: CPBP family intramembrane glutamic endopeptidase [Candidatus Limnocylindrales bacterium]|jgi:membrane protease YdiL (CAAX protease family)